MNSPAMLEDVYGYRDNTLQVSFIKWWYLSLRIRVRFMILLVLAGLECTSQGFDNYDELILSPAYLANARVSSVLATDEHPVGIDHPKSGFVFEYFFNDNGHITRREEWHSETRRHDKDFVVWLVRDSVFYWPESRGFSYKCISVSKAKKFNNRRRDYKKNELTRAYEILFSEQAGNEPCMHHAISADEFMADTILLGRTVHIPRRLFPRGDSVHTRADTLVIFSRRENSFPTVWKIYRAEANPIIMELSFPQQPPVVTYHINAAGLLSKMSRDVRTEVYHYDAQNLHVRTNHYSSSAPVSSTVFTYTFRTP